MGLGATQFLKDFDSAFFWCALAMRFLQGCGNALVQTACYAIITHVFAENRDKYLGYAEAVTGVGLMLGPVLGGPLYTAFGYFESFSIFGAMLFLSMLLAIFITPSSLNSSLGDEEIDKSKSKVL